VANYFLKFDQLPRNSSLVATRISGKAEDENVSNMRSLIDGAYRQYVERPTLLS